MIILLLFFLLLSLSPSLSSSSSSASISQSLVNTLSLHSLRPSLDLGSLLSTNSYHNFTLTTYKQISDDLTALNSLPLTDQTIAELTVVLGQLNSLYGFLGLAGFEVITAGFITATVDVTNTQVLFASNLLQSIGNALVGAAYFAYAARAIINVKIAELALNKLIKPPAAPKSSVPFLAEPSNGTGYSIQTAVKPLKWANSAENNTLLGVWTTSRNIFNEDSATSIRQIEFTPQYISIATTTTVEDKPESSMYIYLLNSDYLSSAYNSSGGLLSLHFEANNNTSLTLNVHYSALSKLC
jgi:hypothetical protein